MFYYIFNNLAELPNGVLAAKTRREIHSRDLTDIAYTCSNLSNVEKFRNKCFIYESKCTLCDAIHIGTPNIPENNGQSFLRCPENSQK